MDGRSRRKRAPDLLTPLWYEALASPLGIEVIISGRPRESVAANLYLCRDRAADLSLRSISIVSPPHRPNALWLVRRAEEPADAPS